MDDSTLASLRTALLATPNNLELATVVCQALLDRGDAKDALAHLDNADVAKCSQDTQRLVFARVLLASSQPERAVEVSEPGETAELLVVCAIALDQLGRQKEAQDRYEKATELNPTVQDVELEARLGGRIHQKAEGPRLRVISNDDTRTEEAALLRAPQAERITFSDVGGLEAVKKQVEKRIILPFKKPSLFQRFKKRVGGGILLYGPPGCGKTLLARACAGECDAEFHNVAISDVLDMYIGESERKLAALFEQARAKTPSVLFFDELEALAGKRQFSREGTAAKLVSSFLSEMDGFAKNNQGVLILGATNVPWAVDPAFRRPGRFDRVTFVPPPDRPARVAILKILIEGRPTQGIDVDTIAGKTSGFSGADLENVVETAADFAIEQSLESGSEMPIVQTHFREALGEVKPTTNEWLTTARNYARYANDSGQYDDVLQFLKRHGK